METIFFGSSHDGLCTMLTAGSVFVKSVLCMSKYTESSAVSRHAWSVEWIDESARGGESAVDAVRASVRTNRVTNFECLWLARDDDWSALLRIPCAPLERDGMDADLTRISWCAGDEGQCVRLLEGTN